MARSLRRRREIVIRLLTQLCPRRVTRIDLSTIYAQPPFDKGRKARDSNLVAATCGSGRSSLPIIVKRVR